MTQTGLRMWNHTKRELEIEADSLLRTDRRAQAHIPASIDLLNGRDAARRDLRRRNLASRNIVLLEMIHSTSSARSTEDTLIAKQDHAHAIASVERILQRFEQDKTVKKVVVTAILGDISFLKTRQLAEACQMREDVIRAAKERVKYFARNHCSLHSALS